MPDYPNTYMKRAPVMSNESHLKLKKLVNEMKTEADKQEEARLNPTPVVKETTEQRYKRLTGRELADDRDGTLEQQIKDRTLAYVVFIFIEAMVVLFIMSFLTVNAVISVPVAVILFIPSLILLDMIKYYGFKLVGKLYGSIQAKAVQDILAEQNIDPNAKGNLTLYEDK